jgi:hypothetical protein
MHSLRQLLALTFAVAFTATMAGSSALGAETKPFSGLKDCGTFPNPPECLITASKLEILRGAIVRYTALVFSSDHLSSPVTLTTTGPEPSTATGQCTFYFAGPTAGNGHCEYWSGTRELKGFHAALVVGTTTIVQRNGVGFVNSLTGTYWFVDDEGEDD